VAIVGLLLGLALPAQSFGASVEFGTSGSRGYNISVKGSAGKVILSAFGPAGGVTYRVPGRVTRHRIAANFGRRGKIDVAFRPGGRMKIETPPHRCEGKPRATRWGAFVGTIRFRGERGFTRVRVRRATGSVRVDPRWRCGRHRKRLGPLPSTIQRSLLADDGDDPVSLELVDRRHRLEGGAFAIGRGEELSLTAFFASMRERRGRMRIRRTAFEFGENRDFAYDESLTEATVSPPFPFAGRATFERKPGGAVSWTGSLSVVLPGTPRISLTGKRFHARLYRLGEDGIAKPGR
jgi:hypothetical protein